MTCLSVGNPHCVVFVPEVDAFPVEVVGPKIENHKLFPKKTNVEFVQVLNENELRVRVWERGCGETFACGTGACAVGVASILHGYTDSPVEVVLPGGTLVIEWNGKGPVYLTGPVERVFSGQWIEA